MDFTAQQCRSDPDSGQDIAPKHGKKPPREAEIEACCGQKLDVAASDSAAGEPGDNEQRRSDEDSRNNMIARAASENRVRRPQAGSGIKEMSPARRINREMPSGM